MLAKKNNPSQKLIHGFIVGNAGNEPSGIITYTLVGARTGFSLILFLLLSTPLLVNSQAVCARIGDVTKKGLSSLIKLYYGSLIAKIVMLLTVSVNLALIGAIFTAIAACLNLLFPQINTLFFLPLIAGLLWYIIVFKSYQLLSNVLTGLGIIFLSYVFSTFLLKPDWPVVVNSILIPQVELSKSFFLAALAMMGTTIAPFMFFWQMTEEIEDHPTVKDVKTEIGQVSIGLIYANIIAAFIVLLSALTFYQKGIQVNDFFQAASALKPLAGNLTHVLFSIGMIGSGLLALPVITSTTAYTIAETFNWRRGLNKKINQARGFYAVLTFSFFLGLTIALLKLNPIKILFFTQVASGLLSPILLGLILVLAVKPVIMKNYVISKTQSILGWLTVLIMSITGLAAIFSNLNF